MIFRPLFNVASANLGRRTAKKHYGLKQKKNIISIPGSGSASVGIVPPYFMVYCRGEPFNFPSK